MHILIALDGSSTSQAAIEFVKRYPFPPTTDVTVLTVLPSFDPTPVKRESVRKEIVQQAERLLAEATEQLKETGWATHVQTREGHVAEQIIHASREVGADLVVVGSHGHGAMHRFLLGSTSQKVMKYAPCSVLLVREAGNGNPVNELPDSALRILAAYDDSDAAKKAIELLALLPLGDRGKVDIVTVLVLVTAYRMDMIQVQSPEWRNKKLSARKALEKAAERLRQTASDVTFQLCEGRDESEEILKAAEEFDADLIAVGATGRSGIERFLLGGVSNRVLHHAHCSVLVVR